MEQLSWPRPLRSAAQPSSLNECLTIRCVHACDSRDRFEGRPVRAATTG